MNSANVQCAIQKSPTNATAPSAARSQSADFRAGGSPGGEKRCSSRSIAIAGTMSRSGNSGGTMDVTGRMIGARSGSAEKSGSTHIMSSTSAV